MNTKFATLTLMTLIFCAAASAAETAKMLRVDLTVIENEKPEPVTVKLNLPLGMIESFKPQLDEALANVAIEGQEEGQAPVDLRTLWQQIRSAGPSRFVEIKSADANVTVDTTADHVVISVDSKEDGTIQANLPMSLGDALLSEENVDTQAIINALQSHEGDLVTIKGDKINGRIWVE